MVSWEDVINSLDPDPTPEAVAFSDVVSKYQDLIDLIKVLPDGGETAAEMATLAHPACELFQTLIEAVDSGGVNFTAGHESDFYAAMSFVTWYLHKSWKSIKDPLTLPYARVFAYIFLVGYRLGQYREECHDQREIPPE